MKCSFLFSTILHFDLECRKKYYDDYELLNNGLSDKFISIDVLNESINDLKNNIINLHSNYYNIYVNIIKKKFDKFSSAVINNRVSNIDNIVSNRNITDRFSKFRGNVIFSNQQVGLKIILINNFNEVKQLTNDEIKFLDENNIILVNIYDEKFNEIEKLSYFVEKEGKSKLGNIFVKKMNHKYSKIINIKYNIEVNNFVKNNFERLYLGVNKIKQILNK